MSPDIVMPGIDPGIHVRESVPGVSRDRTRVKICGITDAAGYDAAVAAGADWIGFNFFPPSPRFVTPEQAAELAARASGPLRVGLFVEPTEGDIAAVLGVAPLDILQIYATPARAAELGRIFGLPVWRSVGIGARAELPGDEPGIAAHLIEPKPPQGATRPGGNAISLDWTLTSGWHAPKPWLLAGGLTPDNVAAAIVASGARAVDVASGVERTRGQKDPALIAAFVAAARATPRPAPAETATAAAP
jgi:phosphoribosylanthranilate isomerase